MTTTVATTPDQDTWTLKGRVLRDGVSLALDAFFVRLTVPGFVNHLHLLVFSLLIVEAGRSD